MTFSWQQHIKGLKLNGNTHAGVCALRGNIYAVGEMVWTSTLIERVAH